MQLEDNVLKSYRGTPESPVTQLLEVVAAFRLDFCFFLVIGVVSGLGYCYWGPRYYTAETTILPPQNSQSTISSQMGALAGVVGLGGAVKSPEDLYVALMKSGIVRDELIRSNSLLSRYDVKEYVLARKVLDARTSIQVEKKSGIISVAVDDEDPILAEKLANDHYKLLKKLVSRIAINEYQQQRLFLEQQISENEIELDQLRADVVKKEAESGVLSAELDAEASIREAYTLRAHIAELKLKISAMSGRVTEDNPEYRSARASLSAMSERLSLLGGGGATQVTKKNSPEFQRALRKIRQLQAKSELLGKQLEIARIEEAKSGPVIQQVDVASKPERALKPSRTVVMVLAVAASLLLASSWVAFRYAQSKNGMSAV
jgi:tyrosine-protein kinase Etk/Wzc